MNCLLDSHVLLWWLGMDSDKLSDSVRDAIARADQVCISVASVWELEIKRSLGKLDLPVAEWEGVAASGLTFIEIALDDAVAAAALPPIHRDPFDRMLVAQARNRGLTLVTRDARLLEYGVPGLKA
ncbi:type II toxin-antitoxin system VapC family toxin [uncultured Bosea sp.]|uniref:type II toxin-antitoxin system VapC family toxin n=1 Tax=uncultured Bosea sp. TaxID=211457 RepID=UPI00263B0245|nr:type II toxin-antitoxin system VapC family toxin [uncultured Bosea sp.]